MTMKRIDQIWGCITFIFFLFVAYKARTTLTYWGQGAVIAPGPGYLPFWTSVVLAGLSLIWLIQVTVKKGEAIPKGFFPARDEGIRILLVFLDMIVFTAIVKYVGFPVAMFLFVLPMVAALGKHDLRSMIYYVIFALGSAVFFSILFGQWLEVAFPMGEIEIFNRISSWIIRYY